MQVVEGKCSHCLEVSHHQLESRSTFRRNVYICTGCDQRTVRCRRCDGMAKVGPRWADEWCSDHWDDDDKWHDGTLSCISEWPKLWKGNPSAVRKVLWAMSPYKGDSVESFSIRKLNTGLPSAAQVVCVNGFLSQSEGQFADWTQTVRELFPDSSVYGVRWESRRTGSTGERTKLLLIEGVKAVKTWGASTIWGWHHTSLKAKDTGKLLAHVLMRAQGQEFVLCGHSLGARVIVYALMELARHSRADVVRTVHLMGGAVGRNDHEMWRRATGVCEGGIANYYSEKDDVLKRLYVPAMGFMSDPIGRHPIDVPGVRNVNVSDCVGGHDEYKGQFGRFASYPKGL